MSLAITAILRRARGRRIGRTEQQRSGIGVAR
jgi:hypothetical protein